MKNTFLLPLIICFSLSACVSRKDMAISYYHSTDNYKHISSCFYRANQNKPVFGQGANLIIADLHNPPVIQISRVDQGVEFWEVDFSPNKTGTSIELRVASLFGLQDRYRNNLIEKNIIICGGSIISKATDE